MGELRNEGPSTSHATNLITPSQFNNVDQLLDMEESVVHATNLCKKTSNNLELVELLTQESYKSMDALLPYPQESDIVPIAIAHELMKGADITWIVTCEACNQQVEIHYMSRANLVIEDGTVSICGTITSPQIEKVIPFDTVSVQVAEQEAQVINMFTASVASINVVAFIRSYETWHQHIATRRVVILNAYKLLQRQIQRFKRQSNPINGNGSFVIRQQLNCLYLRL
ncbi:hypothetical protein LXL04_004166 [Taraxacum kok-saghyz]